MDDRKRAHAASLVLSMNKLLRPGREAAFTFQTRAFGGGLPLGVEPDISGLREMDVPDIKVRSTEAPFEFRAPKKISKKRVHYANLSKVGERPMFSKPAKRDFHYARRRPRYD